MLDVRTQSLAIIYRKNIDLMAKSKANSWQRFKLSLRAALDTDLTRLYGYQGPIDLPDGVDRPIWAASVDLVDPPGYFLHYFQSQQRGPTTNECVTTAVVMSMNILEDRISAAHAQPIQCISNLLLEEYTRDLDARGLSGWRYRFSTNSPLPGMMTPWQAVLALKDHAFKLKAKYGRSYTIRLKPRCTVNDLISNLKQGNIILIHGAWQNPLTSSSNRHLAFLGGMPHTMLLVGYDPDAEHWFLLDPGYPPEAAFRSMTTPELLKNFWGRKFLFYPPRFSITILTPEQ
jgi:hypothetical protein